MNFESLNLDCIADWNATADSERRLNVAWLLNPGRPPQQNVRITVLDSGIADVSDVPADEHSTILPCALIPRLINAHTHLEFSNLRQPLTPGRPFPDWVRSVIQHRNERGTSVVDGVKTGMVECFRTGTAAVGEISTTNWCDHDANVSVHVTDFRELIGLLPNQVDAQVSAASQHLSGDIPGVQAGLSPHAPYSVHPDLFDAAVDLARKYDAPVAMHLAETREELQLLRDGSGPFVEFLKDLGLWRKDVFIANSTPLLYLQKLAELPTSLAVHGNYFADKELGFLSRHPRIATAFCPRTHHYFGHTPHPWKRLLRHGATVVIGTDSRASNPDLSVWKELQFLARLPDTLPWPRLLELATTHAARVLRVDHASLQADAPADGILLACAADSENALETALSDPAVQPLAVLADGLMTRVD